MLDKASIWIQQSFTYTHDIMIRVRYEIFYKARDAQNYLSDTFGMSASVQQKTFDFCPLQQGKRNTNDG